MCCLHGEPERKLGIGCAPVAGRVFSPSGQAVNAGRSGRISRAGDAVGFGGVGAQRGDLPAGVASA